MKTTEQTQNQSRLRAKPSKKMLSCFVGIVLGRPSKDCRHFGICKIEVIKTYDLLASEGFFYYWNRTAICACQQKVYGYVNRISRQLIELVILRDLIKDAVFEQHFASGLFLMEEPYQTSERLFDEILLLRKGTYNIDVTDSFITIKLPVYTVSIQKTYENILVNNPK